MTERLSLSLLTYYLNICCASVLSKVYSTKPYHLVFPGGGKSFMRTVLIPSNFGGFLLGRVTPRTIVERVQGAFVLYRPPFPPGKVLPSASSQRSGGHDRDVAAPLTSLELEGREITHDDLSQSSETGVKGFWAGLDGGLRLTNPARICCFGAETSKGPREAGARWALISLAFSYLAAVDPSTQMASTQLRGLDLPVEILVAITHLVLDHGQVHFLQAAHTRSACVEKDERKHYWIRTLSTWELPEQQSRNNK